jgi:hypothetical protein
MRPLLALVLLASFGGCAHRVVVRDEPGFAVRDYVKTAYDTLVLADPDTGGHRIRAQLEARAAFEALGSVRTPASAVPFEGPPTLAVALELLERSEARLAQYPAAQAHARVAVAELREALR